jgi:hypothetical protein
MNNALPTKQKEEWDAYKSRKYARNKRTRGVIRTGRIKVVKNSCGDKKRSVSRISQQTLDRVLKA